MAFLAQVPERPEIQSLGRVYESISKEIMALLLAVDLLNYTETKANAIRKKIDQQIRRLNSIAVKHSKRFIPDAYNQARRRSDVSLRVLGRREVRDSLTEYPSHDQSIKDHVQNSDKTLISANGSIRKTTDDYLFFTRKISIALQKGSFEEFGGGVLSEDDQDFLLSQAEKSIESGVSRQTISARIRDLIRHRVGDGNLIVINGRYYKIDKYAKLVARTEMRASQSSATVNSCERYENDLVEVSDHGTTTEICEEYEGETYSISGKSSEHAVLAARPPYHPNCQHFLMPTSEEAIAFEKGERK